MSAASSVILDRWAKIRNCPTYSLALPVCRKVLSLALAFPGISEMRKASSIAFLHAAHVPNEMVPFRLVFSMIKDSFHAWADPLFMKERAKTIFLLSSS